MNFTYLLGAGASANTMPVIANFAKRLDEYLKELKEYQFKPDVFPTGYSEGMCPSEIKNVLQADLALLRDECQSHSSIDTFVRKLYLTKNKLQLFKAKAIINDFLLYEQYFRGIDKRYDTFFATILNHDENENLKLPENINILSWNYDKQIEYSFGQFYDKNDQDSIESFLNIYPRKEMKPIDRTCFSVVKLNGTIGGRFTENIYNPLMIDYSRTRNKISARTKELVILNILSRHNELTANITTHNVIELERKNPTILYSWENSPLLDMLKTIRSQALNSRHYLIIIGYSFPTFNREIDKIILESITNLRKIFLQIPEKDIKGVEQRLRSLIDDDTFPIELIPNIEEFYIPFEY
jgi:hypothetical protein